MRQRYPETFKTLIVMAALGLGIGVTALWAPAVFILVGALWLGFLIAALRADRKRWAP